MSLRDLDHKQRSDQDKEVVEGTSYLLSLARPITKNARLSMLLNKEKMSLLFHGLILNQDILSPLSGFEATDKFGIFCIGQYLSGLGMLFVYRATTCGNNPRC